VAQKKTAHGAPWTKEDLRELRAHSKSRTPPSEIAKKMKRTEPALRRKAGFSASAWVIAADPPLLQERRGPIALGRPRALNSQPIASQTTPQRQRDLGPEGAE
jgi:hypothetical protein